MSAATTAPNPPADLADVGILCVHGIGVQVEGETLRNIAGPLFEQLEHDGATVEYGETVLKPRQQLDPGPARIAATLTQDEQTRRVLLAESHWADVFDAPSYSQLLGWLMGHGTWIAIRHAVFSLSTPVRWLERWYDRRKRARPDWLGLSDIMVGYVGALVCVFLVALPLQLFLLLVGALALLPFLWTHALATRVALGAAAVLGDASVYSADTTLRHAILTRVRKDLAWLTARTSESRPIIILAHSQGAAVVYDLLSSMPDLTRIRLITYGEGIRKLTELTLGARKRPFMISVSAWLWLPALAALAAGRFAVTYIIESIATPGAASISDRVGSLLLFYLLVFFFLSTMIYIVARSRESEIDEPVQAGVASLLAKHLTWADLYASADPVPRGPLLGNTEMKDEPDGWSVAQEGFAGLRSRRVVNQLSTIGDHTSYWNAPNDFVPLVAGAIRSWIGVPAEVARPAGRMWRLWLRKIAGWAITLLGILTFWRAGDPLRDVVWMRAWNLMPLDPTALSSQVVARYSLRDPAVTLAGLVAFLTVTFCYGRFVLNPAWLAWERAFIERPRGGAPPFRPLGAAILYWAKRWAPHARLLVCVLVVAAPVRVLVGSIRRGNYGPTLESVTSLAERGRSVAGWAWVTFFFLAILVVIIGSAGKFYEWWQRRLQP